MDKKILNDYIDACEYLKETEDGIKRMEKKRKVVQDRVKGSNPEWPYEPRSFNLGGVVEIEADSDRLREERCIRDMQRKAAADLKLGVEEWMQEIPFRMQRIIRYKIFDELTWEEVATLIGRKATGDSVRMEFNNFMKK